jgi:hypothetical protein
MSRRRRNAPFVILVAHTSRRPTRSNRVDLKAARQMLLNRSLTGNRISRRLSFAGESRVEAAGLATGIPIENVPIAVPRVIALRPGLEPQRESRRHSKARRTGPRTFLTRISLRRLATKFRITGVISHGA